MRVYRTLPPGTRLGFSHTTPAYVVENLDDLRGPADGIVKLPVHIDWTPASTYDLADDERVRTMYATVLREAGSESEVAAFVNRRLLAEHWAGLNLPAFIADAWEDRHPELKQLIGVSEHPEACGEALATKTWVVHRSERRAVRDDEREREDRTVVLSRALHAAVEPYILADWDRARAIMLRNIAKQIPRSPSPLVRGWIAEWEHAIQHGPDAVIALSRLDGERGNDLRQMTPLAGVLPFEIQQRIAHELPRGGSSPV